jgi:hypothetical protein
MRRFAWISAALGVIAMSVASLSNQREDALGQGVQSQSLVFLCNETSLQIVAQYTILNLTSPMTLTQALGPLQGGFNSTESCFPVRIPNYAGPIAFTGTAGDAHFPTKTLTTSYGQPVYVWYYNEGVPCWGTGTSYKLCLEL